MPKCYEKYELKKQVAEIYWLILKLQKTNNGLKGIRCYESARIFYNILKELGYKVEIVNGGYILSDEKQMRHSWVEQIIDDYGTSQIIETTPHLFFPKLTFKELVGKMVISPDDEGGAKYCPISDDLFRKILEEYQVIIEEQLVERYSSKIIQMILNKK